MKKIIIILILLGPVLAVLSQEIKNTAWDYPVKPGSKEWNEYVTGQQMLDACRIPDDVLKDISTGDLAHICLDYPLYADYLAFNDTEKGIETIIDSFNGLTELAQRNDGASQLLSLYKEYSVSSSAYRLSFLELLIANNAFIDRLNAKELLELENEIAGKYKDKCRYPEVYSPFSISSTLLLKARVSDSRSPEKRSELYLYTPNKSPVYAFTRAEMSQADIAHYTGLYAALYPHAEVLDQASQTYNSHSYTWNMVEGGPTCWLNQNPDLHNYWNDGSYTPVDVADTTGKVYYYMGDHSAVVSETHTGMYESKWGILPLMRHAPDYVPAIYNMEYRRYYTSEDCTTVNFIGQTIDSDIYITGCNIYTKDVVVEEGGSLILDASKDVIIDGEFEVELGAEFEVK